MSALTMTAVQVVQAHPQYRARQASFAGDPSLLADWRNFEAGNPSDSPMLDPEWIEGYFFNDLSNISTYLLYKDDLVCGAAAFVRRDWPLKLYLGEVPIKDLPVRRLLCLGNSLKLPAEELSYDVVFGETAARNDYDALYFTQISTDSFLWKYLNTSSSLDKTFIRHVPEAPTPHPLLRIRPSYDDYLRKFNKMHRHTLRRKVSRFREEAPGEVRFERYTHPGEVDTFLEAAVEVSKKTYQWNLHQRGLRETDLVRTRLAFAARHGWFRSYVLFCGDSPCAFLSGYQWKGRYYTDEIGFDPALAKRSPGTVLQVLAIQDLHAHQPPELIDFGSYDKYKEEFSNDSYMHCSLFLFRRNMYARLIKASDLACRFTTRSAVRALKSLHLKGTLKRAIRDLSTKSAKRNNTSQ